MSVMFKSGFFRIAIVILLSISFISMTSISFAESPIEGPAGISYTVKPDGSIQINDGDIVQNNETIKSATMKDMNTILGNYKNLIVFINAIGLVSMIMFFIVNFMKLGLSSGNPQERKKAITALILSGITIALLGSILTFMGFAYNIFN